MEEVGCRQGVGAEGAAPIALSDQTYQTHPEPGALHSNCVALSDAPPWLTCLMRDSTFGYPTI